MNPQVTREGLAAHNLPFGTDTGLMDHIYVVCDSEFNSRYDVHASFAGARGVKSWAKFHLMHEVREVCVREDAPLSMYQVELIAMKISQDWFGQAATVLN